MAGVDVDELDRRIIACLQVSGRQTNTQIAGELGVGESTVRKRIDRLLANEVIKITAVANPLDPENMLKPSGRGIFLINGLMDEVQFTDGGRELQMKKKKA